ncbi:hypothetical protein MPOCJGCO_4466 [Methylobacterium trifolii]|uniref:Energy transducer TonB n=2 Tax=Methylobacterium trifolii TaxID=1003092 RepID=A0ABQ4U7I7_9HYPH|nr:hypothetical protein MPOCJGCO_4466 [Methylobacterium trifolii]
MTVAELPRSDRITARRGRFSRRSRIAVGPLHPARLPRATGIGAGILTGGLAGLAVIAAFTLPFMRSGAAPEAAGVVVVHPTAVVETTAAVARPAVDRAPVDRAPVDRAAEPAAAARPASPAAQAVLSLDQLPVLEEAMPDLDMEAAPAPRPPARATPPHRAERPSARCKDGSGAPCPARTAASAARP